jgi:hypothetical protein
MGVLERAAERSIVAPTETEMRKARGKRGESPMTKCCASVEVKAEAVKRAAVAGARGRETGLDSAPKAKRMLGGG